jgi:hypothetical protein
LLVDRRPTLGALEGSMQVVRIDPRGRALEHVAVLKKSDGEELSWVALGNGGPWEITFDKGTPSPFSQESYTVGRGGIETTQGGPINGNVRTTYKYNVRDPTKPGHPITDDPDVDIE